jgi:hypothetical protein
MENENEIVNKEFNMLLDTSFKVLWDRYPKKDGKKQAFNYYKGSIKNKTDIERCGRALDRYLNHIVDKDPQYIKLGKTWFYNWEDWETYEDPMTPADKKQLAQTERQIREFEKNAR